MIPAAFDYVAPRSLDEALAILARRPGEAKLLAGGYSLIPLLKLRLAAPALLVDVRHLAGLDGIAEEGGWLRIGARATHHQVERSEVVRARYPILAETAAGIGDPQIRNWGTLGGAVAHADPAADWPGALIAAGARFVLRSLRGERAVAAEEFFVDAFTTRLEADEMLVELQAPRLEMGEGAAYEALERKAGDFSTAGVGARVRLAGGRIAEATIGVTAVAPAAFRARDAEAALVGQVPAEEAYRTAGRAVAAASRPVADLRGSEEYKRAVAAEMTVRALRRAVERARAS